MGLGEARPARPPGQGSGDGVEHLFTVDVEEYFQVSAFDGIVSRGEWDALPSRVELQVERLLEILAGSEVRGTFFVLGWVAERHPSVVRAIADGGHEVASHGWWHRRIATMERDEFREEARRSKRTLEDLAGRPVHGFRAANFSLSPGTEWALDVLIEEGYRYDSSVYPVRWLRRGHPRAPRFGAWLERPGGRMLELPAPTARPAGLTLPAGGGAYFRHLPYGLTRSALLEAERAGTAGVFYLHPWELDPDQPRFPAPVLTRIRHYGGLEGTEARLRRLLREFAFTSVEDRFGWAAGRRRPEVARAGSPGEG